MTNIVPFAGVTQYPHAQTPATPGMAQGVYITLHPDALETISQRIAGWFAGWEEIRVVDKGVSDKVGLGFMIIEWMECEIDRLFLVMLRDEEAVGDYTVYGRVLEG
jgi:hypothetical protein